jgi:hypothetical protein
MLPMAEPKPVSIQEGIRDKIAALEHALHTMVEDGVPTVDLPLKHTFTDGVYIREIYIPKDTIVVGLIHKHDHLNYITFGKVTVLTKDGLETLTAPCSMISTAGTKRALYTHEDTIWTTIHANPTEERDVEKLVASLTVPSYALLPKPQQEVIGETL